VGGDGLQSTGSWVVSTDLTHSIAIADTASVSDDFPLTDPTRNTPFIALDHSGVAPRRPLFDPLERGPRRAVAAESFEAERASVGAFGEILGFPASRGLHTISAGKAPGAKVLVQTSRRLAHTAGAHQSELSKRSTGIQENAGGKPGLFMNFLLHPGYAAAPGGLAAQSVNVRQRVRFPPLRLRAPGSLASAGARDEPS